MLSDDLKTEFEALLPAGQSGAAGPSRRTALQAALGLGLGYAAAAQPLQDVAQTGAQQRETAAAEPEPEHLPQTRERLLAARRRQRLQVDAIGQ